MTWHASLVLKYVLQEATQSVDNDTETHVSVFYRRCARSRLCFELTVLLALSTILYTQEFQNAPIPPRRCSRRAYVRMFRSSIIRAKRQRQYE
jgi:hypothetical protein